MQEAVRRIVASNRSVYDCLRMGLINYTALAARIRPEVEKLAGGQVNPNTVVVAVKRYADALGGAGAGAGDEAADALRNARISLTDGVMDMRLGADGLGRAGGMAGVIERISRVTSDFDLFRLPGLTRLVVEDLEGGQERRAVDPRRRRRGGPHGAGQGQDNRARRRGSRRPARW